VGVLRDMGVVPALEHPEEYVFLRQARVRESVRLLKKIGLSIVCVGCTCLGSGTVLTWPVNYACPATLIDYWMGIT
jgi:hypothetical protein